MVIVLNFLEEILIYPKLEKVVLMFNAMVISRKHFDSKTVDYYSNCFLIQLIFISLIFFFLDIIKIWIKYTSIL